MSNLPSRRGLEQAKTRGAGRRWPGGSGCPARKWVVGATRSGQLRRSLELLRRHRLHGAVCHQHRTAAGGRILLVNEHRTGVLAVDAPNDDILALLERLN